MLPTLRICSAQGHQPLIKFLGKRAWPSTHPEQHAHPFAPPEIKKSFGDFLKRSSASAEGSPSGSGNASYNAFWEAPERYWRPKNSQLEDAEIEAILSGGAS